MGENDYLPIGEEKDERNKRGYGPAVEKLEALYKKTTTTKQQTKPPETPPTIPPQITPTQEPQKIIEPIESKAPQETAFIPTPHVTRNLDERIAAKAEELKQKWIEERYRVEAKAEDLKQKWIDDQYGKLEQSLYQPALPTSVAAPPIPVNSNEAIKFIDDINMNEKRIATKADLANVRRILNGQDPVTDYASDPPISSKVVKNGEPKQKTSRRDYLIYGTIGVLTVVVTFAIYMALHIH